MSLAQAAVCGFASASLFPAPMVKFLPALPLLLMPVLILGACAPKAVVVEEVPVTANPEPEAPSAEVADPENPNQPVLADDGIRLPDMLTLPSDNELRSARAPATHPAAGSGAVIARPPTEP